MHILLDFLWEYKRHRIAYAKLTRSFKYGGLNIPSLEQYYETAQLVPALKILGNTTNDREGWKDLESLSVEPSTLCATLWNDPKDRIRMYKDNLMLQLTVSIWNKWKDKLAMRPSLWQTISPFFPAFAALSLALKQKFVESNVVSIGDLIHKKALLTKTSLEELLQTLAPCFLYFQLNSFVTCPSIKNAIARQKMPFKGLLQSSGGKAKRALAALYQFLSSEVCSDAYGDYSKWNTLLNSPLSKDSWGENWNSLMCSSLINAT